MDYAFRSRIYLLRLAGVRIEYNIDTGAIRYWVRTGSSVSPQILNAACNIYSKVTLLPKQYDTDRHGQQWKTDTASFFAQGLGLALLVVAKTCPHQPQAFKEANRSNGQAFSVKKSFIYFF